MTQLLPGQTLRLGARGELRLAPTFDAAARSLQPARYLRSAKRWTTATPLVLDRHLKEGDGPAEMEAIVRESARRATGLTPGSVRVHKHAAVRGVPSASPSGRAPSWTGWTAPEKLRSRRLTHATLVFHEEVPGPLLLGAGRYCGLGLCLPISDAEP